MIIHSDLNEKQQELETVSVLVVGATFTGLGIAYADKERTLVVERTSGPGQEYIACFHPGEGPVRKAESLPGKELREELVRRNLLSDDSRLHLGALIPVLMNRIAGDGLRVRFLTEVVGVKQEPGGEYVVTLFDASGLRRIRARHIVDTTSTCLSAPMFSPNITSRRLNAFLHCVEPEAGLPVIGEETAHRGAAQIVQGRFPGEVILKLRVDSTDDMPAARGKLYDYWLQHAHEFRPWTLAIVADVQELCVEAGPHSVEERWVSLPSCSYNDVLASFEAGYAYGKEGIRNEAFTTNR